MNATYAGALAVSRESIAMMRRTLAALPPEALDWRPAGGMNSIAVLASHAATSLRFFAACGAGRPSSILAYRNGPRAASFTETGSSAERYLQALDSLEAELVELFSTANEADLEARIAWPDEDPSPNLTGAECLFRAIAHFREHLGHAQSVHDLWLAREPAAGEPA